MSLKRIIEDFGRGEAYTFLREGGSGRAVHFAHATAFPPLVYRAFLKHLFKGQPLFGLGHRCTWPSQGIAPPESYLWRESAEDLIAFLDAKGQKEVIGVGHSFGGVISIMAAAKRPDLFHALILIEPGLFSQEMVHEAQTKPLSEQRRGRLIEKTLGRPDRFEEAQDCFEFHRPKRAFSGFSDEVMWDFCHHGLERDQEGALRLLYPKEWEAHIYQTPPFIWDDLSSLEMPVMGIRAAPSRTLQPWMWERWGRLRPQDLLLELEGVSHLAPLDDPEQLAARCNEGYEKLFSPQAA